MLDGPSSSTALENLGNLLDGGGVLAVPTESSYGLAADPRKPEGVLAIYRVKGRDAGKPLPVVAADLGQIIGLGVDSSAPDLDLLHGVWPAPLTAVLPLRPGRERGSLPAAAGEPAVAVRVPAHKGLRSLLAALGRPLTATSANRSGEPPVLDPVRASELLAGEDAVVIDGGGLPGGPPSTIVRLRGGRWEVLREGAFSPAELERLPDRPAGRPLAPDGGL